MATINGTAGNDTLVGTTSTDIISGLGGNDRLQGSGGNDSVLGGAGNDLIFGNDGTDWVEGGAGNDSIGGGGGQDSFVFREAGSTNADVFNDFSSGWDNIRLDAAFFTTLGAAGQFTSGDARFWSSSSGAAHDADDRILYNTSTRQLWYDADGNGSGVALLIGTLNSGATLTASDIHVFGSGGGGGGGSGQTINGTPNNDSLVGGSGNDTINGLAGNDTLVGLAGDDVLDGGPGADSMDGGLGNDTFYFDHFGDVLVDAGGIDTLVIQNGGSLPDGIENLVVRNAFQETDAVGNSLNNVIRIESSEAGSVVYVTGGAGNDTVDGAGGFIVAAFEGNFGNDSVQGGARGGWLDFNGSAGSVVVQIAAGTATSSAGNVTFTGIANVVGSNMADRITAGGAGSQINGFGGDDTLIGGAGNDLFFGEGTQFGAPVDTFGTGNDSIFGGGGNDTLFGNDGNDTLDGGLGNDRLGSGFVADNEGSEGNDTFMFTVAPGTANADVVTDFDSGADRIVLDGNAHASSGASGNFAASDVRFWSSGTGTAHDGDDRVIYNSSNGQLWYDADGNGAGARQLIATLEGIPALTASDITIINGSGTGGGGGGGSVINGTSANDTLTGTAGNDTINGLGGNDLFVAGSTGGADVIAGGTGTDSIEFRDRATSGVVVDFGTGTITGGSSGTISFTGVERVVASNFADSLTGAAGGQTLTGQGGADTLWGGGGVDTLWGGGGNDAFVFREMGSANADRVSDFASGADKLQLDDAAFTSIGAMGNFAAGDARFWASSSGAAHDSNDRVLYNTSTGQLYYDADGNGSGAAQLIATLLNNPGVAATDITVI
jgi:Ca2+-binding RTX toxin-like protein